MNVEKVKEALEIGLNAIMNQGWTRNQDKEIYLISDAIAELEKPAEDVERAYQVLEVYGVPRGRAKTLANGIDVLETRYRKDRNCFENEKQQYAESYHAKECAACKEFMADNGPEREA